MIGYTDLIRGCTYEAAAYAVPEPHKTALYQSAMDCFHASTNDENMRRERGDKPDHVHLTYL